MGCSASQSVAAVAAGDDPEQLRENKPIPPPTSFEIPLDDNEDVEGTTGAGVDSLIKKHPPRRLEERLAKQLSPPQTISDLADKLANAELRRQSILRERVNNIRNNLKREGFDTDEFNEEEEETNGTPAEEEENGAGNQQQQQPEDESPDLEDNSHRGNAN